VLHAARCKCRTQKSRQKSPSGHHRTTLSGYIFATEAHIDNRKKMLSSNISSTCPHSMVNFGPLAAEIVSLVWAPQVISTGFPVLAALLHGTLVGVSQTLRRLTEGGHLYSAGRPSRWALAHISSCALLLTDKQTTNNDDHMPNFAEVKKLFSLSGIDQCISHFPLAFHNNRVCAALFAIYYHHVFTVQLRC